MLLNPGLASAAAQGGAAWFLEAFAGLTLWGATACVVLCVVLAVSPAGRRRIGGEGASPEFGLVTWLSMLFAAGMGAGLVFWGSAEPLIHLASPPPGSEGMSEAQLVRQAHALTQFNWALHGWSIYAVAALAIGIATKPGAVPLPSAPFTRLTPGWRRAVDWTALLAVLFGVVASLGQGVFQLGAGTEIASRGALQDGVPGQIGLLVLLVAAYLASLATGLARGIAFLSVVNVALAVGLAAFVVIAGPTGAILRTLGEASAAYAAELPRLSFDLRPEGPGRQWTKDWTLTYFLWWAAWAPFMGVFVARISRGRTVRGFLAGVVLVPSLATLVWFSIFGGAALEAQRAGADLGVNDFATAPKAAYVLLETLPFAAVSQALTLALVFLFLVTSADSGAYVLGQFSRRKEEAGMTEKVFWGVVLAAMTGGAILSAEGQSVTRAFAVTGAIPLTLILFAQALTLLRLFAKGAPKAVAKAPGPD